MFELELINLINEFKKTSENYEKNKIITSISNLIRQNPNEYQKFIQLQPLDEITKQLLKNCEIKIENILNEEHQNNLDSGDDFEIIKEYYYKWLENYNQNGKEVNEINNQIVREIISHYLTHRYQILEKIFNLEDGEDFENFKWHIKNELRIYFLKKIDEYLDSENYKNKNFFQKIRKDNQIKKSLKSLSLYKFENEQIQKLIQN